MIGITRGASLFITVVLARRQPLFVRIVGRRVELNALGCEVARSLDAIPSFNRGVIVHGRVVMPDHVHFNVCLKKGLDEPLKVLGNAIRRFKNHITKVVKLSLTINTRCAPFADRPSAGCVSAGDRAMSRAGASGDGRAKLGRFWQPQRATGLDAVVKF